jgi:pSer/pThr/pTyr-binding forkhead associated (FHA) protein
MVEPEPLVSGFKTQVIKRPLPKKATPERYQASVVILEGYPEGMEYPIKRSHSVIGRNRDAAVPLTDPLVSREHAAIIFRDDTFILKDLGSTNGTYMRGESIKQRRLSHGDKFQIGNTILQFILQDRDRGRTYEIR